MKLADLPKLHHKKYRDAFGCYLIEGEHLVLELQKALPAHPELRHSELYVSDAYARWSSPFTTHRVSSSQLARLAGTETPQGIVACVPILPAAAPSLREKAIYLYEIQDPGNLGTILRTLSWFGGLRCLLSPGSVDPYNLKAVRASAGALFHVALETDVPLSALPSRYARIASLLLAGSSVREPGFRDFDCYVFGNEARGLPADALASVGASAFTIPGAGVGGAAAIESLNLAAAVGISVYELTR